MWHIKNQAWKTEKKKTEEELRWVSLGTMVLITYDDIWPEQVMVSNSNRSRGRPYVLDGCGEQGDESAQSLWRNGIKERR